MKQIREAKLEDYEAIKNLENQALLLHYKNREDLFTNENIFTFELYSEWLNDDVTKVLVYEEQEKIIGLLIAEFVTSKSKVYKSRKTYFIIDLVVDENNRQQGIGNELYNALLEDAKENNIDAILLNVYSFNSSAIKFYEKLGFSVMSMQMEKQLK